MSTRLVVPVAALLLWGVALAPAAEAQSDRAAWLAWRTGKEARSRA